MFLQGMQEYRSIFVGFEHSEAYYGDNTNIPIFGTPLRMLAKN